MTVTLRTDEQMIMTGHHDLFLHAKALQEEVTALRRRLIAMMPDLTPTQLMVLRVLRTTKCATKQETMITEFRLGSASISWHTGSEVKSVTVLPSTLKRLRDLGLVEFRGERSDMTDYALSEVGRQISQSFDDLHS